MKQFIRKIILYSLPLLLFAIIMEIVVEQIPNSYTYKQQYMENNAHHIKNLILGSSIAYDGIDAKELNNAFNLANSSQCFEDDYRLLSKYIDKMDSLQNVILPMIYASPYIISSSNRRVYYTIYMDIYPRFPISKYSFECFNLELMAKKCVKAIILHEDMMRCDSLGQRLGHTLALRGEDWKDINKLVSNDTFTSKASIPYFEENNEFLNNIALICQKHNVNLWLIEMPVMPEYKEQMPLKQIHKMETMIDDVTKKYPNVHSLNYQDWGDSNCFWNATHLNTNGAKLLTKEINYLLQHK